ncbi:MAG: metal ABC transporter permease [Burkholderiales bacterium]|jgi:zinc transport system permease protein|nr:metal ABC transporter permease [Burkholderiales bacterium]
MNDLPALLALPPVQRGLAATLIAGAALPVAGLWLLGLNLIPFRFAIMHVALLGIALALLAGLPPLAVAVALCALAGAALTPFAARPDGLAGPIGLLMTVAIALALLALAVAGVNANAAFELLWGSVLAVGRADLGLLAVVAAALLGCQWLWRRPLRLLLHDRDLALCSGVPAQALTLALLVLAAVSIAAAIRLTGALLVDAVTLLPAIAARNLGRSLDEMTLWAIGLGLTGSLIGFAIVLAADLPPGPVAILTMSAIVLASYAFGGRR